MSGEAVPSTGSSRGKGHWLFREQETFGQSTIAVVEEERKVMEGEL